MVKRAAKSLPTDYFLYQRKKLLGTLHCTGADFPWFIGTFKPTKAFAAFTDQFVRESQLLDEERIEEWEKLWSDLRKRGLRLLPKGKRRAIRFFAVHLKGNGATWRY